MSTATHARTARVLGAGLSLVMVSGVLVASHGVAVTRSSKHAGAATHPRSVQINLAASTAATVETQHRTNAATRHPVRHHARHAVSEPAATQAAAKPAPEPTLGPPTYPAHGLQAPYRDVRMVPSVTELATLPGSVPGYSSPTASHKSEVVPGSWYGRVSVLPVVAVKGNRIKVRTAQRPNEHEVWINRSSKIYRSSTTYALVLDLRMRHLFLFKSGRQIGAFPVGVGLPRTPTPTGTYFVAFHAPPNSGADYGSVMLETSAHSEVYKTFEGGNDAIIAIHGPITSAANRQIGTQGTRVSNGCIRMHDNNLVKVGKVPDGTPFIAVG